MFLSPMIESYFSSISAASVTEAFSWLLLAIFIASVALAWARRGKKFTAYSPTLMTSLGILGTFVGIVIGLMHFDTADIDGSIPILLGGLKTAFITSVCGLVGAVVFTSINTVVFSSRKTVAVEENQSASPELIYASLEAQRLLQEKNTSVMAQMQKGLTGDEEGSLIGQFKLLRADMASLSRVGDQLDYQREGSFAHMLHASHQTLQASDQKMQEYTRLIVERLTLTYKSLIGFVEHFKQHGSEFDERLFKELADFADMMSRSATEAIIEALKNVIQDFNEKLTEQFGDNFKALDASVKKLVDWQEEYRLQVEKMGEQYQQSVDSLVNTRESVAGIWQECQNIPQAMDDLREIIDVNQHQIKELAQHLEAFVQMRDKAVEAVPTIQEKVQQVTNDLAESSTSLRERLLGVSEDLLRGSSEMKVSLEEGAEHFRNSVTTTQQSFNELSTVVKTTSEQVSETLTTTIHEVDNNARDTFQVMQDTTQSARELSEQITRNNQQAIEDFSRTATSLNEELASSLRTSQNTFEGVMREAAENSGDTINAQLEQIEQSTAREIQRAMQEMATQLMHITGRFVSDYEKMVQAMERVINSVR
mgnify:CR=1 FL=1